MLLILLACAPTLGVSERLRHDTDPTRVPTTIALAENDGVLWYALHLSDPLESTRQQLDLLQLDGGVLQSKTLSTGSVNRGLYPDLSTEDGAYWVQVQSKQEVNGATELVYHRQRADDFWMVPALQVVNTSAAPGLGQTRRNPVSHQLAHCYTLENPTDDVAGRIGVDQSLWGAVPESLLAGDGVRIEDHCSLAFDHQGTSFVTYHQQLGDQHTIRLLSGWLGGVRVVLPTPTSARPNFAQISIEPSSSSSTMFVAAADMASSDLLSWSCDSVGAVDCSEAVDWQTQVFSLGGEKGNPKALVAEAHRLVLYEMANRIWLAARCADDADVVRKGQLTEPDGVLGRAVFGSARASAMESFLYDDESGMLHAVYLQESAWLAGDWDAIRWSMPLGQVCP